MDKAAGDVINAFSSSLHLRNHSIKEKVKIEVLCYDMDKVDGPILLKILAIFYDTELKIESL